MKIEFITKGDKLNLINGIEKVLYWCIFNLRSRREDYFKRKRMSNQCYV